MKSFAYSFILILIFSMTFNVTRSQRDDGVLEKIKSGLQYATSYLEKAKDLANLVSQTLNHKGREKTQDEGKKPGNTFVNSNIMGAFFRLFGLDSQKVAAIAVNSVIFLAQTISSLFGLKQPSENIGRQFDDNGENDSQSSWDPLKFILESKSERIQKLIDQARDQELPNQLIERVDGLDSACIRLLICKVSPIIKAAQNSLKTRSSQRSERMTSWMPSKVEFEENSDTCEGTHTDCTLFPEVNN